MIIALIATGLGASVLILLVEIAIGAEELALDSMVNLGRDAIGAAIWIPYFQGSKRVKATFVN